MVKWDDDLHGRSEGVESAQISHPTHLTNSLPALSLCMTGRGESWAMMRRDRGRRVDSKGRSTALHTM